MNTRPLSPVSFIQLAKDAKSDAASPVLGGSFEQTLGKALDKVNELQIKSMDLDAKMASGQLEYLHQAMVASEKAGMSLQFTLQLRNKVLEAYQEIMRTQI